MTDSPNNVAKIGSPKDREFYRVDGQLYLHIEPLGLDHGTKYEAQGLYIPTFSLDEDDIVGLSIDAFREHVMMSEIEPAQRDFWLRMQQIMSMMKRSLDAELLGRKPKLFTKTDVNISGSGIAFSSEVPYTNGQGLRLALFFPRFPYTYLCLIGEVIRSEKKDEGYLIRAEFKGISEKNQDEVLRFVNQCQRDNRRR